MAPAGWEGYAINVAADARTAANAAARESYFVSNEATTGAGPLSNSETVALAQQRQYQMLKDNMGYNISPLSWDQYPTIGQSGTYLTDKAGITNYFGNLGGQSEITITTSQAAQIERGMGLVPGSLQDGFSVRQVTGITDMIPNSPLEGNAYFQGPGNHLPNGSPEIVVQPVPTVDSPNVTTILTVHVK